MLYLAMVGTISLALSLSIPMSPVLRIVVSFSIAAIALPAAAIEILRSSREVARIYRIRSRVRLA